MTGIVIIIPGYGPGTGPTVTLAIPPEPVPPTITTTSINTLEVGTLFSQTLTATGDSPMTWSKDSGTIPPGLALSSAGVLSGNPTPAGSCMFVAKAVNSVGSDTQSYTVSVAAFSGPHPLSVGGFLRRYLASEHMIGAVDATAPVLNLDDAESTPVTGGPRTLSGTGIVPRATPNPTIDVKVGIAELVTHSGLLTAPQRASLLADMEAHYEL